MTDEQEMDLSAESETPDAQAEVSESGNPAAGNESAEASEIPVSDGAAVPDGEGVKAVTEDAASEEEAEAAMLAMLDGLPEDNAKASPDDINFGSSTASRAEFQQLQEPVSSPGARNIDLLMDVDLPISIELGRTKMAISDILGLGPGSVVELNKLAGEPVDLLVNYKVVARGEVVVVDENFGLRITQLMTPEERLKALAEE